MLEEKKKKKKKNWLKYRIYIVDNEKIDELKLRKNESPVERK